MFEIIGALVLIGLVIYVWKTIPKESEDVIRAREEYGKAGDAPKNSSGGGRRADGKNTHQH